MTEKISDFTATAPVLTDYIAGATLGVPNKKFLASDLLALFGGRPAASGNMNFYVATTGSDSNSGTIGSPFATIQHAIDVADGFDWVGNQPTINIADGTYTITNTIQLPNLLNAPQGLIAGNNTTPGNVVIFDVNGNGVFSTGAVGAIWTMAGFQMDTSLFCFNVGKVGAIIRSFTGGKFEWTDRTASGPSFIQCTAPSSFVSFIGTITCLTNIINFFAFVNGIGTVTFRSCNINFQAATAAHIYLAGGNRGLFQEVGNTYSNLGTMTGIQCGVGEGFLVCTADGTEANLGGNVAGGGDGSCSLNKIDIFLNVLIQNYFTNFTASGLPTVTDIPTSGTWSVYKDTSGGGVYVAYNDAGTIKKVALT